MSNPRFIYTNLSKANFYGVDEDPAYPLVNLLSYLPFDQWRSLTSPGELRIDFGAPARLRDSIVIENHNLGELGGDGPAVLEAADDEDFTSGVVTVIADLTTGDNPYYAFFTGVSKRYWRIRHASTIPGDPLEIGQVFLDRRLDFGFPYDFPANDRNAKFETAQTTSLDGTRRTSQPFLGRLTWQVSFQEPGLPIETVQWFQTFFTTVRGKLRPFYFINCDDAIYFVGLTIDQDKSQLYLPILDKIPPFGMEEWLANRVDERPMIWDEDSWDEGKTWG